MTSRRQTPSPSPGHSQGSRWALFVSPLVSPEVRRREALSPSGKWSRLISSSTQNGVGGSNGAPHSAWHRRDAQGRFLEKARVQRSPAPPAAPPVHQEPRGPGSFASPPESPAWAPQGEDLDVCSTESCGHVASHSR